MKKTVEFRDVDPLGIAGVADVNLKILEEAFPCKILLRGSTVTLEGSKEDTAQVEEVLMEMMRTYSRKDSLTEIRMLEVCC